MVEIDECLLVRWKYNVGHQVEQQWVFGGVHLDTNNVFMAVNHFNFVDPNTGATTNHIESTWQKAKQKHK